MLWKLAESGRQLDANVVRLAPGDRITAHTETQLDVMLLVVSGDGVLGAGPADESQPLTEGTLACRTGHSAASPPAKRASPM